MSIAYLTRDSDHEIEKNPNLPKHVNIVKYEKNDDVESKNGQLVISFGNIFANLLCIFVEFKKKDSVSHYTFRELF